MSVLTGLLNLAEELSGLSVKQLVDKGYPEEVAQKIASGELPMDPSSITARQGQMGMTDPTYYRGHPSAKPPTSNDDMFVARDRRDIAETYASGGEAYEEATDSYIKLPGEVTPLRTNASKFIEADGMGDDWTYPTVNVPGVGFSKGTDEIARNVKRSRETLGNDLQGSLFTNVRDDIGGDLPPGDVANILGSQPEVKIRHADRAAYDPDYNGPNIMGGLLAGGVGLGALSQSEDADASLASLARRGLSINQEGSHLDGNFFSVRKPDGVEVAHADMGDDLNGGLSARYMEVYPEYRGDGLMNETYDAIEEMTGKGITPSPWMTEDGVDFWVKRDRNLIDDLYNNGDFSWDEVTEEAVGRSLQKGSATVPALATAGAGLGALSQSEDADAGIIRAGVDDVTRLIQMGMLKTDSDQARNGAIKKYDKLLQTNPAFAHREEMAGDNLFQTIRQQEEFDVPILTMEDLKGYALAPIRSDRSMIGTVDQVGGIEVPRVDVQGGFQFPMKHQGTGRGWGSGESIARGQHSKMQAMGEETGQEVLGIINMMGPESINFSTPIADIMHSQFAKLNKIPAADKLEFDDELRRVYKDWPGIDSPESVSWLRGGGGYDNVGKKRTAYTTIMGKAKYRDKGFPNYDEAVEAASHTGLKDLAYGDSGMAIYKPDLTRDIYADDAHDTYSHIMPGEIVGRLEEPVPFSEMFGSNYQANRGRTSAAGKPFTHDQSIVASNIRKDGYEVADGDWYNGILKHLDGPERGSADPRLLAGTAAGTAGLLAAPALMRGEPTSPEERGFASWEEVSRDPTAPLPAPTWGEAMGKAGSNMMHVLGLPMTGLQGIARGGYGLLTGEDFNEAAAQAGNTMDVGWKDGLLDVSGMNPDKGADQAAGYVTDKTGDESLGWMVKMGLLFGGL